jgi:hypothetical protein
MDRTIPGSANREETVVIIDKGARADNHAIKRIGTSELVFDFFRKRIRKETRPD